MKHNGALQVAALDCRRRPLYKELMAWHLWHFLEQAEFCRGHGRPNADLNVQTSSLDIRLGAPRPEALRMPGSSPRGGRSSFEAVGAAPH